MGVQSTVTPLGYDLSNKLFYSWHPRLRNLPLSISYEVPELLVRNLALSGLPISRVGVFSRETEAQLGNASLSPHALACTHAELARYGLLAGK